MRAMVGLAIGLALLAPASATSRKMIEFSYGSCDYSLSFDPKRVDELALRATVSLLYWQFADSFNHEPKSWSREDALKADLPTYRAWCATEESRLRALPLLDIPGLEDLRRRRIAEHADHCQLVTAKVQGARGNVGALRTYARGAPVCAGYVDALERSDADFVPAWRVYAEQFCRQNSSKPDCRNGDLDWLKKPDGVQRLRDDLLSFGWENCANGRSLMSEGFDGHDTASMRLRDAVAARFEKTQKVKTLACDHPD